MTDKALALHAKWQGKFELTSRVRIESKEDLAMAYTPGVALPCKEIEKDPSLSYTYTRKGNLVAVISDGSAVLGLGNIGPRAAMPVMEGKAILFKRFADVDAIPLCLDSQDVDELVQTISLLAPSFGGINLEDISAPRCFEVEQRLKERLDIPVFHDDQHGTAIVAAAAVLNALKVVDKEIDKVRFVVSGPGAAGTAIVKMLQNLKAKNILVVDKMGILSKSDKNLSGHKLQLAKETNQEDVKGSLEDAVRGSDVFIGVSAPGILTKEMVATMNPKAIVFAMANPTPEILPEEALAGGAVVVGTGRSDFPNQVNNVLAFPGIFRGALDARATDISEEMKVAAAKAIAALVEEADLSPSYVIPTGLDERVVKAVARAVYEVATK